MAVVTRSRDRGQLILVAGLTVAVILVMLVLLLNTVIYTENLATRGIDSEAGDAIEYRATVVGSVEELIERENEHYDEGHPPEVGVKVGIEEVDRMLSERHLERGTIAEVRSSQTQTDVSSPRIWQNESSTLTANGGESDWTVVTTVTDTGLFVLTVDSIDAWVNGGDNERLRIVVDDPETESSWILKINASDSAAYEVIVNDSEPLSYQTDSLEIDLVSGTINENPEFSPPPESGTIGFRNGDTTTGTFELHATGTASESDLTEYDGGSGGDPYYTYPVASVDLRIHYETSELRFATEETIVPEGEP